MKRSFILLVLVFVFAVLFFFGCSQEDFTDNDFIADDVIEVEVTEDNLEIVATFYPILEITEAIVLDSSNVSVLVPAGVEPHSYEPSPFEIVSLSKADVFIIMGGIFENIEKDIIDANPNIEVIDATHNLELLEGESHEHGEEDGSDEEGHEEEERHDEDGDEEHENEDGSDEEEHDEDGDEEHENENGENGDEEHENGDEEYDPHVWLSINNMKEMTREVEERLSEMYPHKSSFYSENAQVYLKKLDELENEFEVGLLNCNNDKIIVNHEAFGYLANEYGFEQIGISGFTPHSEPTPKTIQRVISVAEENNLKYIFSEGQLDSKTSHTIANDVGAQVLELNPLKMNEDEDYFSVMRSNLNNLRIGLDCS